MALRLLRSLFRAAPASNGPLDDPTLREAIERVVDGVDPRLRAVSRYRHKLRDAVAHSLDYVTRQITALPPAVEVSRRRFTTDPCLRALFISPEHLLDVLNSNPALQNPAKNNNGSAATDEIYAVLRAERVEKIMLGVSLESGVIQRDVPQTTINFHNHRLAFPNTGEAATRRELTQRAFDYLIEAALQRLVSDRAQKQQLEQQQRQLLQKKARILKTAETGLEALLADASARKTADTAAIERQLREIEAEFSRIHADSATLDHHLEKVIATLRRPEKHLRLERVSLTLNHMNIKVSGAAADVANTLTFNDALIGDDRRVTVLLVRFSRSELPGPSDFFSEAQQFLYLNGRPRLTTL